MNGSPQKNSIKITGNPLGADRAEIDAEMLEHAFVKTHDYEALVNTRDFNFVVGRRGTGKTATYLKLQEYFKGQREIILHSHRPEEYESIALSSLAQKFSSDYRITRSILRVIWRTVILLNILDQLRKHWKRDRIERDNYLSSYAQKHKDILSVDGVTRCAAILRRYLAKGMEAEELPGIIASDFDLNLLEGRVKEALSSINNSAVVLFDGLDEGWEPTPVSTALLGGLALAVADLRDHQSGVHGILFVRDNLFRALAKFDPDFSRHIEGSSLRLHWDENGLLVVVANRLRVHLNLEGVENDIKIWNRFAHRELQSRDGFIKCLQHTLYRPRDILVLLNQAFHLAARGRRTELIEDDIESVSLTISNSRLSDLLKEYEAVFPGLGIVISAFRGSTPSKKLHLVISELGRLVDENDYSEIGSGDLAVFGSGEVVFNALYSIGFLGFQDTGSGHITFRHDGGEADVRTEDPNQVITIHPCYWKALGLNQESVAIEIITEIHDEYENRVEPEVKDIRNRQLGTLISELSDVPLGQEGATQFEDWVFRSIRILFQGVLVNPELKPNRNAIQRRDVVATNMAQTGFWRRILDDYQSRQVVFEVKNYTDLKPEDYRQAISYMTNEYGRFLILVCRSGSEAVGKTEQGWLKTMYHEHEKVILTIPATLLSRCIRKVRNPQRRSYSEEQLSKRLDVFLRSYLSLEHISTSKKRRNRGKS